MGAWSHAATTISWSSKQQNQQACVDSSHTFSTSSTGDQNICSLCKLCHNQHIQFWLIGHSVLKLSAPYCNRFILESSCMFEPIKKNFPSRCSLRNHIQDNGTDRRTTWKLHAFSKSYWQHRGIKTKPSHYKPDVTENLIYFINYMVLIKVPGSICSHMSTNTHNWDGTIVSFG